MDLRTIRFRGGFRPSLAATLVLVTAGLGAAPAEVAGESGAPVEGVLERLRSTMEGALDQAPLKAAVARLEATRQALTAESSVPGPMLEAQSEGLGGDLSREANAADSLRLTSAVPPGLGAPGRAVRAQAQRSHDAKVFRESLETAASAGRAWLELAAAREQEELARHRLERLDRVLVLHRKRLELGEVAGAEVTQLELQRATDSLNLRGLRLGSDARAKTLETLAGDVPGPRPGDLVALTRAWSSAQPVPAGLDGSETLEAALEASPYRRSAEEQRLLEHRRAAQLKAAAWGLPEVEVEVQRIPALDLAPAFQSFGFRVAIPLPVGRHGRALRAQAQAAAETADIEARLAETELQRRVLLSAETLAMARGALAELEELEAMLPRTEHSLAEQFRLGAVSYLVYSDGLARLDALRGQLIAARLELLQARLELAILLADDSIFPLPDRLQEPPS